MGLRITKRFPTLEKLDHWLNTRSRRILEKIGIFKWDITSSLLCFCDIVPETIDLKYIEHAYPSDVTDLYKCMLSHYGEMCFDDDGEYLGILVGIQATQEDMYWKLERQGSVRHVTCCQKITFDGPRRVGFYF